jgi:hypothetical protein
MDLRHVFASVALILLVVVAGANTLSFWNASYGTTAGSSFNNTLASVSSTLGTELATVSTSTGENTFAEAGPAASTQQQGLISRSISTIQQVGSFFTIIPNLLADAAQILGLPEPYAQIAAWTFTFFLGIAIALIFLQVIARFQF